MSEDTVCHEPESWEYIGTIDVEINECRWCRSEEEWECECGSTYCECCEESHDCECTDQCGGECETETITTSVFYNKEENLYSVADTGNSNEEYSFNSMEVDDITLEALEEKADEWYYDVDDSTGYAYLDIKDMEAEYRDEYPRHFLPKEQPKEQPYMYNETQQSQHTQGNENMSKNDHEVTNENRLIALIELLKRGQIHVVDDQSTKENPLFATLYALANSDLVTLRSGWFRLSNAGQDLAEKTGLIQYADFSQLDVEPPTIASAYMG
jgi:hypothetical protein